MSQFNSKDKESKIYSIINEEYKDSLISKQDEKILFSDLNKFYLENNK
jgi:hypothetical protein